MVCSPIRAILLAGLLATLSSSAAAAGEPIPLAPGDAAPDRGVQDHTGAWIQLADLWADGPLLLYFYPKDFTPNCTQEAIGFRDAGEEFYQEGVRVVGVSINTVGSHRRFVHSLDLPYPLLADVHAQLARAFGVDLEVQGFTVARRVSFLIDEGGEIAWVWDPVDPVGHADAVLERARTLGLTAPQAR